MVPYAGVDYNLTLCPLRTFTMGNPMTESTLTQCQSRLYPPVPDFGFDLSALLATVATVPVSTDCKVSFLASQ